MLASLRLLLLAALLAPPALALDILHVDPDASGLDDGTSWDDAYEDLVTALGAAVGGDTLRLAEGVHAPGGPGAPRSSTFTVPAGVTVEGGYAGVGAADPNRRDPVTFPTVLTGDLDGDDLPNFGNRGDNAYHVVTCTAGAGDTRLDGLTITAGAADGPADADRIGGGLVGLPGASVILEGCLVSDCLAQLEGAGVRVEDPFVARDTRWEGQLLEVSPDRGSLAGAGLFALSSATLVRCTFSDNLIDGNVLAFQGAFGGGAAIGPGSLVRDSHFVDNAAEAPINGGAFGGGLHVSAGVGPTDILRTVFEGNVARSSEGARGGGLDFDDANGHRVVACVFAGNEARGFFSGLGGGLYLASLIQPGLVAGSVFTGNLTQGIGIFSVCHGGGMATGGTTDIRGCSFSGNTAEDEGGAVWAGVEFGGDAVVIANSVLWGNDDGGPMDESAQITVTGAISLALDSSCVQGLTGGLGGTGNIGLDPLFADVDGADDVVGTADDDLRLTAASPAIDAGDNALIGADGADVDCDGDVGEAVPLDGDGFVRRVDDPLVVDTGSGGAPVVDMGAFELGADLPQDVWTDLGLGLAGGVGTPLLSGAGSLCPGQPFRIILRGTLPSVVGFLVLGSARVDAPFKGGTLVPSPDLVLSLPTGPSGQVTASAAWIDPSASGLELFWQVWIPDPAGIWGFAASNALSSVAP